MNDQSVRDLQDALEAKYKGLILMLSYLSGGDEYSPPVVRINTISISKDERKQGLGSEIMSQIISWADTHGVMLTLSPSTDFGATSVARLTRFYRRFGFVPNKGRNKDFRTRDTMLRNPKRVRTSAKRDDPKLKNTGHGGLDTWFAGHGGGKPDERATWGDWIAVTPIKHTIKKDDGEEKVYEAGDIVGPCAVSSEAEWASITDGGKNPLKCMPRDKAHDLTKEQRATLARKKRREESKAKSGQKPVHTPTFSEKGKQMISKKASRLIQFTTNDQEGLGLREKFAQYSDIDQFRKLLGSISLQDFEDRIEKSVSDLLLSKSNYSKAEVKPYNISGYEWAKTFEKINTQHKKYNPMDPINWGYPPKIERFLPKLGGRFVVVMSGKSPYIIGTLNIFYCIKYTTLEQVSPTLPLRKREHEHIFYSIFPVEINLRNSKELNRIYLEWVRGSFSY